jgi:hypothetical protein
MNKYFVTLAAVAALVAPYALAEHCEKPYLDRNTEELRITDPETGAVIYYIDNDPCQLDCTWSFWIYEETNGFANLQRQDATGDAVDEFTQDDTCHGKILPDTIVF